ncbi:MAG: bifunctional diguanylate cyclase/phosphodiesterase [Oscillospiraceae bacterium]
MMNDEGEQSIRARYQEIVRESRQGYALATLKIKRFRRVNRLYGRDVGDGLLQAVETAISSCLGEGEFVAQVSVNYYNLLLRYTSDDDLVDRVIQIVRVVRDMPDERFGGQVFTGLGAFRLPAKPVDFDIAQYNADLCRTESEHRDFRNSYVEIYGLTYQDPNEFFLDPQNKIQPAIDAGDIRLYLQPKVNLKTGTIDGGEVLMRWIDPQMGMIPLEDFLPSLNATGLIRNVDLYLFDQVCALMDSWHKRYDKKIKISVNLAGCSFNYKDFFEDYREIFERYDIPKDCMQFELLESIILNNVERVQQVVGELRDYGFTCALDDFGSGFSSYTVLKNADLSTVKIDRSLFGDSDNPKEKIVVRHIVQTAHELDMVTVAEGVEDMAYVRYLQSLECEYVQGFVFYKPMPAAEFEERFLRDGERAAL